MLTCTLALLRKTDDVRHLPRTLALRDFHRIRQYNEVSAPLAAQIWTNDEEANLERI